MGPLSRSDTLKTTTDKNPVHFLGQASESTVPRQGTHVPARQDVKTYILHSQESDEDPSRYREPPAPSSSLEEVQKICSFWYHGDCKNKETCRFVHRLVSSLPLANAEIKHKKPCGLQRCRWRDETPKGTKRVRRDSIMSARDGYDAETTQPDTTQQRAEEGQRDENQIDLTSLIDPQFRPFSATKSNEKKRKFSHYGYHPDDPRSLGVRKTEPIDYDEKASSDEMQEPDRDQSNAETPSKKIRTARGRRLAELKEETCFFWYHGNCRTPRCPRLHDLTYPPSMVQPPRGYVHKKPCGRPWCPGDSREGVPQPEDTAESKDDDRGQVGTEEEQARPSEVNADREHKNGADDDEADCNGDEVDENFLKFLPSP